MKPNERDGTASWRRGSRKSFEQRKRSLPSADERSKNPAGPAGVVADPYPFVDVGVTGQSGSFHDLVGNREGGSWSDANVAASDRSKADGQSEYSFTRT